MNIHTHISKINHLIGILDRVKKAKVSSSHSHLFLDAKYIYSIYSVFCLAYSLIHIGCRSYTEHSWMRI